jgi:MFS family permease
MTILAAIAGPLAGGMIVANFGFRVAFAVAALLFFAALPLAWRATEAHGLAAAARAGGGGAGVDVVAAAAATAAGMGAPAGPAGDEGIAASTRKPSDPARAAS